MSPISLIYGLVAYISNWRTGTDCSKFFPDVLTTVDVDVAVDIAMIVDDALDDDDVIAIKNLHLFILESIRHKLLINNLLRIGKL